MNYFLSGPLTVEPLDVHLFCELWLHALSTILEAKLSYLLQAGAIHSLRTGSGQSCQLLRITWKTPKKTDSGAPLLNETCWGQGLTISTFKKIHETK